jgi:hypothetical protein
LQTLYQLKLNIFGTQTLIEINSLEVEQRLQKDFASFLVEKLSREDFKFKVFLDEIPYNLLPNLNSSKQSINSITYDDGDIRYNDYYKEALSIYDYKQETCELYSLDIDRLHEIIYLIILSRTGKLMDKNGHHKVHACGVSKNSTSVITMLPMKGGKTTLFSNLIEDKEVEIISDDSPVVGRDGVIHAYPLRIGLEEISELDENVQKQAYTIDRKHYGKKFLIPTAALGNKILRGSDNRVVLINGIRCSNLECSLVKVSWFKMFTYLMHHMVIGIGLPMIIEYFLRPNLSDWILNFKIGASRLLGALRLALKSENYVCYMGQDPKLNAQTIKDKFIP